MSDLVDTADSPVPLDIPDTDTLADGTLPDLYVGLEAPLLAPGDGIVTDRHHVSADRYEPEDPMNQDKIARVFIEQINQVQKTAPEEGLVTCQACAEPLRDGRVCTALAVQYSAHTPWRGTHVRCGDHPLSLAAHTTLGVRQRLVVGRCARVVDHTSQRDWPVVLGRVRAVSPARTTTAIPIPLRSDTNPDPQEARA
jgi:hypothetical protein